MTTQDFQRKSPLQIFLSYFRPHRKLFIMDLACALLISLIDLAFPAVSRWCMYELLPQSAYRTTRPRRRTPGRCRQSPGPAATGW